MVNSGSDAPLLRPVRPFAIVVSRFSFMLRALSYPNYTMAFLGTAPFGSLLAGWLSTRVGAPQTVLMSGVLCLATAAWFAKELPAIRVLVRPIYVHMGILPEVAQGLQTAANLMTPAEQNDC